MGGPRVRERGHFVFSSGWKAEGVAAQVDAQEVCLPPSVVFFQGFPRGRADVATATLPVVGIGTEPAIRVARKKKK